MHETSLIFAMHSLCRLAHVDSVPNGSKCACHCPSCGEPVIAVNGGNELAHHFRHQSNASCAGGYESMAHLLAKEIIAEVKRIRLPELRVDLDDGEGISIPAQIADLEEVLIEEWAAGMRPDATVTWQRQKIGIEIYVTNRADRRKIDRYRDRKMAALEIDLSMFRDSLKPEIFRRAVLSAADRHWLYHPFQDEPQRRRERNILRHNAEIARSHAVASGDPNRIALVEEWFRKFEAEAP